MTDIPCNTAVIHYYLHYYCDVKEEGACEMMRKLAVKTYEAEGGVENALVVGTVNEIKMGRQRDSIKTKPFADFMKRHPSCQAQDQLDVTCQSTQSNKRDM